jgi:hypothetical protein
MIANDEFEEHVEGSNSTCLKVGYQPRILLDALRKTTKNMTG